MMQKKQNLEKKTSFLNAFKKLFQQIIQSLICFIFFFLRIDYFFKILYFKVSQLYFFLEKKNIYLQNNIFSKIIFNKKQKNKIDIFTNIYRNYYEIPIAKLSKNRLDFSRKQCTTFRHQAELLQLQIYRELKMLENLKYFKSNSFSVANNNFYSNIFFQNSYYTPVNFFYQKYLASLEKMNIKQVVVRNILEIFTYFYLPLFELTKFDLELLHSIDNEKYSSYLMTTFYNTLMRPYEQQNIRFSYNQNFDDSKNILILTNLAYTYLNNNIEKYLLNLQTLSYYINTQKNYFFNFYNIFYFNQKYYYLYYTLLYSMYSSCDVANNLNVQQQSTLMYELNIYQNLFMFLINTTKKKIIFKYIFVFVFFIIGSQLLFFQVIFYFEILVFFIFFLFFSYYLVLQYIIFSYDINLQKYNVKKQVDIEKFYLSTYFLTQQEDLFYFRNAYFEELLKYKETRILEKFSFTADPKTNEFLDSFFYNSVNNFDNFNFFEKNINEVLFNMYFEMTHYNYSSIKESDTVKEEFDEIPLVLLNYSAKTLMYWFDSLVDDAILEEARILSSNEEIEEEEIFFNNVDDVGNDDVEWDDEDLTFFQQYEEFLEEMSFDYDYFKYNTDADTFSIEELSDFFYEQGLWRYRRTFGNDNLSVILLKNIQKKLYNLIIFELKKERSFFFKKFHIKIQNRRINNLPAIQKLIENGFLPYWAIDNAFFANEIITRYKFCFANLLKEIEKVLNYEVLTDYGGATQIPISGTISDYNFEKIYSLYALTQTNLTEFVSLYEQQVKQSQVDLVGTIDSFSYNAVALKQLLNTLNNNILSIYFSKNNNSKILIRNQIIFQHYLQFTTIYFEFIPRTIGQKISLLRKIMQHAAFNTVYDIELFFYKYYFSKNYNFFSKSKSTIFLLDMIQYYLKKYHFNFFQIPTKYDELVKVITYFEEFEKRSDLQKQLQTLLNNFESSDFWFGINGSVLELLEFVFFLNQEIVNENKRTVFLQRVAIPESEDLAGIPLTFAPNLLLKYPQYNKKTKLFNEQLLIDLAIPTTLQPVYLFPKYCHTHFICEVDIDFDFEGMLWF